MKIKIKSRVNIAGHWYRVMKVSPEEMQYGRTNRRDIQILSSGPMGECEFPTRIIRLNKFFGGPLMELTFMHEIKHGHQFETGWPQIMSPQVMELDCEQFVSLVASLQDQKII